MWFGDLVTMTWWDDLWLNESFATFASVLCQAEATEYTQAWTTFANVEKSWAYRQDQLPSTHPVAADIPDLHAVEVNFDGITYAKGASVLKQLVAYVGLEAFLAGLRDYFRDHAFANATFGDLLGALEKSSGRDLSHWGRQWLKTTGLNTLSADFDVAADGTFTRFAINQGGAAPGAGETRVHRLAVGIYDDDGSGKLVRIHREELDVDGSTTDVPVLQGVSRGKLILVNDDDLTYCSLRLDPDSLQTVLTRIADIADPLPRTLAWSAAWEMTRDAEMKARDFVELVKGGVHAETEVGVAQRLLLQAQSALNSYADPDWACSQGWPAFADRLLELARGAEAGSDHQLAYVNALCTSALSLRHTAVLAALLDTDPAELELPGLDGRHRSAVADRHRTGGGRGHRRRRHGDAVHRRGRREGPHRGGQAQCRGGIGGQAAGRRQGGCLATGDRGRHHRQHHHPRDRDRLRPARSGGAAATVHRQVLRRHRRRLGTTVQRGRADRRHRPVPVVGRQPGRPRCGGPVPRRRRAARAATPGARGPRRRGAGAAGAGVRLRLTSISARTACRHAESAPRIAVVGRLRSRHGGHQQSQGAGGAQA